ncbi:glycosyltransferase family 4 protein [Candidatus Electronema sp. JM]|uniref:glycosyltransferase family 4 protein n=1 Tax=Candidatus Electronema sp. JM TaxID=3401571 RepID=UPI003AA7F98A
MNILIVSNIYPFQTGGAETQARLLAEVWIRQGHHVTVAGNRIPSKRLEVEHGSMSYIECITIPTVKTNRFTRAASYTISLFWILFRKRKKYDIIYCRFIQEAALLISFFKKIYLIDVPLVACAECSGDIGDAAVLGRFPINTFFVNLIRSECNSIIIISSKIKKELVAIGLDEEKFSYIPNGTYISNPEKIKLCRSNKNKIVFIGRLCSQKGIPYLIQAVNNLKKRNISIELTVIGDGPSTIELKQLTVSMGVNQIVQFAGRIENEKIPSILKEHHIFVLPSLFEGFGIAVIEAMAAGLPVVVTQCGGPEDFVDDSVGRVVNAGDADSLAQALQELIQLSDEELHAMGMAAQERVKNNFDINVIADKYIQLFKQLVQQTSSPNQTTTPPQQFSAFQ